MKIKLRRKKSQNKGKAKACPVRTKIIKNKIQLTTECPWRLNNFAFNVDVFLARHVHGCYQNVTTFHSFKDPILCELSFDLSLRGNR